MNTPFKPPQETAHMPRISVLMPVYNGMPYITEAVESVLAQDAKNWELVISDNGSTDATRAYLGTLQDPRIRVHLQSANLGIFGNMNFLLVQAQASIAKILCADDTLLPNALAQVATFMEERPWCAVSRCLAQGNLKCFQPGQRAELEGSLPEHLYPEAAFLAFATFGNLIGNLSKGACRPQLVLELGGFDQALPYAGDYEGWMRVAARHGIALQNTELVVERHHAAQNSNLLNRNNELFKQTNRLINLMSTKVKKNELDILKRHWTIHFLSQRIPKLARQILAGRPALAYKGLRETPMKIKPTTIIFAYFALRLNLPIAQNTTRKLFARIQEINERST